MNTTHEKPLVGKFAIAKRPATEKGYHVPAKVGDLPIPA